MLILRYTSRIVLDFVQSWVLHFMQLYLSFLLFEMLDSIPVCSLDLILCVVLTSLKSTWCSGLKAS